MIKIGDIVRVTKAYLGAAQRASGGHVVDGEAWALVRNLEYYDDDRQIGIEWLTPDLDKRCDCLLPHLDEWSYPAEEEIPDYVWGLIAQKSLLGELTNEGEDK
jgi:hypothetical protein